MTKKLKTIVDAMGVIYSVGDDVHGLLCPFIAEKGGSRDNLQIERLYRSASLGNMSACNFWKAVNVTPHLENEYLESYTLSNGLLSFLEETKRRGYQMWCLSNDLSEWSRKLRLRFGLTKYITGFVISGDVGLRKPDPAIFQLLIQKSNIDPRNAIFVDDAKKNLDSAVILGFETIIFRPMDQNLAGDRHKVVTDFQEIISPLI